MAEDIAAVSAGGPDGPAASAFQAEGRTVPLDWIDYNGHMMDGYYFLAFAGATDALLDHLGLGAGYRERTGSSIYTVESHICFRAGVRAGDRLRYTSQILGYDAKRLHVFHWMLLPSGRDAATNELMLLHVHRATEVVTAMPPQRLSAVGALASEHAALPVPGLAGRRIAMQARD
jgi:acyl-CoA thioester hydrolase